MQNPSKSLDFLEEFGPDFATQVFLHWSAEDRVKLRQVSRQWDAVIRRMNAPEDELTVTHEMIRLRRSRHPHTPTYVNLDVPQLSAAKRYSRAKNVILRMASADTLKNVQRLRFNWTTREKAAYFMKLLSLIGKSTLNVQSFSASQTGLCSRKTTKIIVTNWPALQFLDLQASVVSVHGLQVLFSSLPNLVHFEGSFETINGSNTGGIDNNGEVIDKFDIASKNIEHVEIDYYGSEFGGEMVMNAITNTVAEVIAGDVLRKIALDEFDFSATQVRAILSKCPNLRSVGWELNITGISDKSDVLHAIEKAASSSMEVFYAVFRDEEVDVENEVDTEAITTLPLDLVTALTSKWGHSLKSLFLILLAETCLLTRDVISLIGLRMPNLEHLRLSNMDNQLDLTDDDLVPLTALANLRSLTLWNAKEISDVSLSVLLTGCPLLSFLSVRLASRRIKLPVVRTMNQKAELFLERHFEFDFDTSVGFSSANAQQVVTAFNLSLNGRHANRCQLHGTAAANSEVENSFSSHISLD